MSPSLDLFSIFARVAETGSFSRAARELDLSKATVSKGVAELEAALGVALLARTTRRMTLTEAGERVLVRALRILEEADAAREEAGEQLVAPRGRLRVTAPTSFSLRYLGPALPEFLARYPDLRLELSLADRMVDLVGEGFDLAVRIREAEDSSLVSRRLSTVRRLVVASPDYWRRAGRPSRPEELSEHSCFAYLNAAQRAAWTFQTPEGGVVTVRFTPTLFFDNADVILEALCAGAGVAELPEVLVWRDVAEGRLEPVLEAYRLPELVLHVLTPGRVLTRKVRVFSDFLHEKFGGGRAPWATHALETSRPSFRHDDRRNHGDYPQFD